MFIFYFIVFISFYCVTAIELKNHHENLQNKPYIPREWLSMYGGWFGSFNFTFPTINVHHVMQMGYFEKQDQRFYVGWDNGNPKTVFADFTTHKRLESPLAVLLPGQYPKQPADCTCKDWPRTIEQDAIINGQFMPFNEPSFTLNHTLVNKDLYGRPLHRWCVTYSFQWSVWGPNRPVYVYADTGPGLYLYPVRWVQAYKDPSEPRSSAGAYFSYDLQYEKTPQSYEESFATLLTKLCTKASIQSCGIRIVQ